MLGKGMSPTHILKSYSLYSFCKFLAVSFENFPNYLYEVSLNSIRMTVIFQQCRQ